MENQWLMSWFRDVLAVASAVFVLVWAEVSEPAAAVLLDQSFDASAEGGTAGHAIDDTQEVGQTFTVGITGRLVRIELQIWNSFASGDLLFDIRSTTPEGSPIEDDADTLASGSIPRLTVPPFTFMGPLP